MRLHRLEVTAFGPFSGTEVVDFGALSDAGLFLIHGQTGAGKTSVLDAVCFALYGQVPGARNAAKVLRSDHAAPTVGPEVTLEATIRGRRFRITRSPAWERPKKRGTGTTTQQAAVIVAESRAGEWEPLSTRLDEAGDLITGLLGMNASQFCQVALLPQGEFAAFLRAGAEERRKVLEKLFGTEVFAQVERWLVDHRVATRRDADALRAAAESTADRIAEAAGTERPGAQPEAARSGGAADETAVLVAWAAELAGQLAAIRDETGRVLAGAVARAGEARAAAERARTADERRRRHAEALRRRAALDERAGERAALVDRAETAARADRVIPLIHAMTERERQAGDAARAAAAARERVGRLVPAGAPADVLDKAERERRAEVAGLEHLRGDAARLGELTRRIAELDGERERLDGLEAATAAAVAELPGRVETLRAESGALRIRAAVRPAAVAAVEEADRRFEAGRRRDQLAVRLDAAEQSRRAAVDAAQEARDRVQELRQARLDGMAAVLARELAEGRPCPVCGSIEHPAPTTATGAVPAEDQVDEAELRYERAQEEREQAAARVERLRAELDAAYEAAGEAALDELTAALSDAQRAVAELDAAAADAERCDARLAAAENELAESRDRHETIRRSLAEATGRLADLSAEQARQRARLDEACGEDSGLDARIARLLGEADALAGAARTARLAETAAHELGAARTAGEAAAAAAGFASADEAREAFLADDERSALRRRSRELDDEEAEVRALLADPGLAAAAAGPAPDLTAIEAGLAAAEAAATTAASAHDRARQRCDRLDELREALAGRVRAWLPAAERHRVAERLAALASGQGTGNRLSMRLSSYVLAARLEQVVAAANDRLARMSAARYALVHTVERAAGDRRGASGGLGLRVADAWTGQERDPVTLSGGESFVTALALALGLADVVTAEAGGTEIGTLFVDEGFGTLDEDTLDEVMDVLDGLRDGGRAVGIVSHVAELRGRIPAQLRITKGRTGSRAAVSV